MKQGPNQEQLSQGLLTTIKEMKPYRNYWLITGENDKWVAKPIEDRIHQVWWRDVEQELEQRGFRSFSKSTQIGDWALSFFIDGTTVSYKDKTHLSALMKSLAQFHLNGQYLKTPPTTKVAYLLFDRLYNRLDNFYYHLINRKQEKAGRIDQLLTYSGTHYYFHAYTAYHELCSNGFHSYAFLSNDYHMLCHRDLASHNWIIDQTGQPCLIDFETASYDLQIGDVWQMCSRILTEHHWDFALFQSLIQSYEEVKPLHSWEKNMLSTLFFFPNEFLRESIGILEKKAGYKEKQTIPYLEMIAFDYPIWLQRVRQMKAWLIK